ncbi:Methyltransferase type 12 [Candidatus Propionivibrio aalborgensis]|uniref:Methyltransferase type 12 n=1 Tax=Candidatus Propionivibrio aalborgensis TaxID=1860101 RepID=A0A1A8Y1F1_9RHOO|nr:class I SAM-dependent methyltransferase [Candidatus Propionivibrio aalborgensis]SBT10766.1 Methyltransferase type 12 [Candidatus Propionivibrio aalborgensis]
MTSEHTTTYFDARAKNWDDDPMKTARAQAVADGIQSRVPLTNHMTALEYGCGTGLLSFALQPQLKHITLADSSSGMLAVLQDKIAANGIINMRATQLDLTTDPLPCDRYILIYSLMTFHHIEDIDKILRDLFSLLVAPGYLCIADLDSEDGSFHGPEFTGHLGFDRNELERKLTHAGFRSVDFTTVFEITKGEKQTRYPVFLMIARKL